MVYRWRHLPYLFLGGLGQVPGAVLGILFKNRGAGEAVPQGPGEILVQLGLGRRRHCPVTFIHHKHQPELVELFVFVAPFRVPLHNNLELLDGGDDHIPAFGLELFDQVPGVVRFVHIDGVILGIGLEGPGGLVVQVLPVHHEDHLVHTGNLGQVMGRFVGSEGLAAPGGVPDEARLGSPFRIGVHGVFHRFDGMDLVGAEQDDGLPFAVQHRILGHHPMGRGNGQYLPGKGQIVGLWLVLVIQPQGQELGIQAAFRCCCNVPGIRPVGHHEHLQGGKNIPEHPFFQVFLDLVEGLHIGVGPVLQLDVDHRQPVDEEGHVSPAVPVQSLPPGKLDLVHCFVHRRTPGHIHPFEHHRMDGAQAGVFPLDVHPGHPVFAQHPFGPVVKGGETELVLHLEEFPIGEGMGVKQLFVVVHQDPPEVVPQVLDGVDVLPEGPLGLLFRQLPEQVLLHAVFRFIGSHTVSPLNK